MQLARHEHIVNVFNAYNSINNMPYRVLCPILPASVHYGDKVTRRCDILGTYNLPN